MVISFLFFLQYFERILSLKRTVITWVLLWLFIFTAAGGAPVFKRFLQVQVSKENRVKKSNQVISKCHVVIRQCSNKKMEQIDKK